jgi:tetratricopeptide (TPR) repeat protein
VCTALTDFLNFTGRWDEWLALARDAESRAVIARDFLNAGWRASDVAWVQYLRNQATEVLACADRAEAYWRKAQSSARERAVAIRLRGLGHQLMNDNPAAIAAFREAVELWRSLDHESTDVAIGLNLLANAERMSHDLDSAECHYREAMRIAGAMDYRQGIATYTGNLAALAFDREDWFGAEALAREALPLSEKVGRQELIARDCGYLASALVRQGKKAEARPYAVRAVEIYKRLGSPHLAGVRKILSECES